VSRRQLRLQALTRGGAHWRCPPRRSSN
jgi:hypothetical protein